MNTLSQVQRWKGYGAYTTAGAVYHRFSLTLDYANWFDSNRSTRFVLDIVNLDRQMRDLTTTYCASNSVDPLVRHYWQQLRQAVYPSHPDLEQFELSSRKAFRLFYVHVNCGPTNRTDLVRNFRAAAIRLPWMRLERGESVNFNFFKEAVWRQCSKMGYTCDQVAKIIPEPEGSLFLSDDLKPWTDPKHRNAQLHLAKSITFAFAALGIPLQDNGLTEIAAAATVTNVYAIYRPDFVLAGDALISACAHLGIRFSSSPSPEAAQPKLPNWLSAQLRQRAGKKSPGSKKANPIAKPPQIKQPGQPVKQSSSDSAGQPLQKTETPKGPKTDRQPKIAKKPENLNDVVSKIDEAIPPGDIRDAAKSITSAAGSLEILSKMIGVLLKYTDVNGLFALEPPLLVTLRRINEAIPYNLEKFAAALDVEEKVAEKMLDSRTKILHAEVIQKITDQFQTIATRLIALSSKKADGLRLLATIQTITKSAGGKKDFREAVVALSQILNP